VSRSHSPFSGLFPVTIFPDSPPRWQMSHHEQPSYLFRLGITDYLCYKFIMVREVEFGGLEIVSKEEA